MRYEGPAYFLLTAGGRWEKFEKLARSPRPFRLKGRSAEVSMSLSPSSVVVHFSSAFFVFLVWGFDVFGFGLNSDRTERDGAFVLLSALLIIPFTHNGRRR